jgi:hypothetical protein
MTAIVDSLYTEISDAPVVRTLLYNLIIISSSTAKQAYYTETANLVASEIPGRIIMLVPDVDNELPASRLFCNIAADGKRTFCGEVITLKYDTDPASLPGQVFPLIAPDLPVYVWNDVLPDSNNGFEWLSSVADIHIIDTCTTSTDAYLSTNTLDMTWLRLDAWMKAIIRVFDNIDVMNTIPDMDEIIINTDQDSPNTRNVNSGLLAAWVADCIDPDATLVMQSENIQLYLHIDEKTVPLTLGFNSPCSSVRSLVFKFSGERGMREIIVEQESDRLRVTSCPEDFLQSVSPEPIPPDGLLLAREIGDETMLHRYSAIVKLAVKIGLIESS